VIPAPYTLQVVLRVVGAVDALGNPAESWADPVPWLVHAYRQGASPESVLQGREPSGVAMTVHAPTAPFTGHDRIIVGAETFAVIGDPTDWTKGPWDNPVAGFEVQLKRQEG